MVSLIHPKTAGLPPGLEPPPGQARSPHRSRKGPLLQVHRVCQAQAGAERGGGEEIVLGELRASGRMHQACGLLTLGCDPRPQEGGSQGMPVGLDEPGHACRSRPVPGPLKTLSRIHSRILSSGAVPDLSQELGRLLHLLGNGLMSLDRPSAPSSAPPSEPAQGAGASWESWGSERPLRSRCCSRTPGLPDSLHQGTRMGIRHLGSERHGILAGSSAIPCPGSAGRSLLPYPCSGEAATVALSPCWRG